MNDRNATFFAFIPALIFDLIVILSKLIDFHLLILQKEKHLTKVFENKYLEYEQGTPRYIIQYRRLK